MQRRRSYPSAARSYLVVLDQQLLWQRAPTQRLQPASLAKLLTALVVLDSDWNAERWITVSKYAASVPPSRLGLKAGEQITAGAALAAMLIRSANDACRTLVESVTSDLTVFQVAHERARHETRHERFELRGPVRLRRAGSIHHGHRFAEARSRRAIAAAHCTPHCTARGAAHHSRGTHDQVH